MCKDEEEEKDEFGSLVVEKLRYKAELNGNKYNKEEGKEKDDLMEMARMLNRLPKVKH